MYVAESDTRIHHQLAGVVRRGSVAASADAAHIIESFSTDWILVELDQWRQWRRWSVSVSGTDHGAVRNAQLIAYDSASDRMRADLDCRFGTAATSPLLLGYQQLLWDNCHSSGGASGGALFVAQEGGYQLVGMRLGTVFDQTRFPQAPDMGERFDTDTNINVSLLLAGLDLEGQ